MASDQLLKRTKTFAVNVVKFVETLPRGRGADIIGKQLLRCGTSVGANFRASFRSRSQAEFVAKLGIVEEEADESIYWLEVLTETGIVGPEMVKELMHEANQITAIVVSSIKTARNHKK